MQILLLMVFGALGTLTVNILGCFCLGAVAQYSLDHLWVPPQWRVALTIGLLGGFTTFSSFGWETIKMLEDAEWGYVKYALH